MIERREEVVAKSYVPSLSRAPEGTGRKRVKKGSWRRGH